MLIAPLAIDTPVAGFNGGLFVHQDLSIIEQLHLGDRCRLMVVKIRGEELLIGVTRESISILDKLSGSTNQ